MSNIKTLNTIQKHDKKINYLTKLETKLQLYKTLKTLQNNTSQKRFKRDNFKLNKTRYKNCDLKTSQNAVLNLTDKHSTIPPTLQQPLQNKIQ